MLSYSAAPSVDSPEAWGELQEWLPSMLEGLLTCSPFSAENPPPKEGRGIYLFSDGDLPMYVGRTSITSRTREAKKEARTNFFRRWEQHTGSGSPPNSAPFANKLARELAVAFDLEGPAELKKRHALKRTEQWWGLRRRPEPPDYYFAFQEAKRFIGRDLDYRLIAFEDDVRGVRSHVAEVYTDAVLQARYGDFSTS